MTVSPIELGLFVVAVVGAAVWLKSSLVKQRHEELENLAQTRGDRVADLETRVEELQREVSRLSAKYEVLEQLKAEDIAQAVVTKLRDT